MKQMSVLAIARSVATDWDYTAEAYHGIYKQAYLGRQLELAFKKGKKPRALQRWLQQVTTEAEADRSSLMLITPKRHSLVIAASVGISPEVAAKTELQIGQRMAGFVAHTGRPLLIRNRQMAGVARLYVKRDSPLTSSLILPVHHHGRQIGVLNLARGQGRLAFTEVDKLWLYNLARQVAPLLEGYAKEQGAAIEPAVHVASGPVGYLNADVPADTNPDTGDEEAQTSPPRAAADYRPLPAYAPQGAYTGDGLF
jgi:putative methionine-R-sulfoxide reductase with GAF domain